MASNIFLNKWTGEKVSLCILFTTTRIYPAEADLEIENNSWHVNCHADLSGRSGHILTTNYIFTSRDGYADIQNENRHLLLRAVLSIEINTFPQKQTPRPDNTDMQIFKIEMCMLILMLFYQSKWTQFYNNTHGYPAERDM